MLIPLCGRSIPAVCRWMLSAKDNCRPAAAGSPARKHGGLRMTDDPKFGFNPPRTRHGGTPAKELAKLTSDLEFPFSVFQVRISSFYFGVSTCTPAPRRRRAARTVFDINMAMVNGPTPPGTGV